MRKKNIKDYLHLYLGCDIMEYDEVFKLDMVTFDGFYTHSEFHQYGSKNDEAFKLILRPLSDMIEEEKKTVFGNYGQLGIRDAYDNYLKPEGLRFLLSKHFDLFGLIEAGLAIDKTTLNLKPGSQN